MKKALYLLSTIFIIIPLAMSLTIVSCSSGIEPDFSSPNLQTKVTNETPTKVTVDDSEVGKFLKGNHKLAKVKDGKYLYLYNVTEYRSLFCSFIWELPDGTYSSNFIHYDNVRFLVDPTVTEPYIKFNWEEGNDISDIQYKVIGNVNYAVIVTNNTNFQEIISYGNHSNSQIVSSDN